MQNGLISRMKNTLALAVLVLASQTFLAQQSQPVPARKAAPAVAPALDIPIPDIKYTKFVLRNGLTVLVHEDHKAPIVAVNTWYHVGSKNEKPGKTGFAHLFEHLMFSGSDDFNHTYINAMEKIGATNLNGTTNNDRTNYFENVPTSMLDYALFAESDRMGHLLGVLDQKKLDLQRGVVQNEKRAGENQPYGVTEQTHHGKYLSRRSSVFLDGHRFDAGPRRRLLERCAGMVQDVLRSKQRHAGHRGRHHARSGAGESGKILRRDSSRTTHRET